MTSRVTSPRRRSALASRAACALCILAAASTAEAAPPSPDPGPAAPDTMLERLVDSAMAEGMRRRGIPGAAIAVVRDGRVVLRRGYGVADLRTRAPVRPDETLFGVSSVSKVFTALAVLQLADQGRLRLDEDVNRYLGGFRLPAAFGRPVTLGHLLTHTGGFDEQSIGVAARNAADVVPLGDYLARDMPARVRPPGEVASYSNHGFALAGLIVERAAGRPFAAYVRDSVLIPLGMRRSGFEQPLPAALERARATPYEIVDGRPRVVPRIYFNDAPASALYTTADDMARLVVALLAPRDAGAPRLPLGHEGRSRMLTRQFGHHPALRGLTYGFRERIVEGVSGVEQGGDWQDYSSALMLAPEHRFGAFVAFSAADGGDVADSLWRALIRRLASDGGDGGAAATPPGSQAAPAPDLGRLAGTYRLNRYSRHSMARLGVLTGAIPERAVESEGGTLRALATRLVPSGPGLFRREDTGTAVVFRSTGDGRAAHMFLEDSPYVAYERVPWYDMRAAHAALLGACVLVFAAALITPLFRRRGGAPAGGARALPRVLRAADALALSVLLGLAAVLAGVSVWEFQYGVPSSVRAVLLLGVVLAALAAAAAGMVAAAWTRAWGTTAWRWRQTLHALAVLAFVAFLVHWRLLG
jgi:CubicO group peptidase (beta-lactamase class C family)